MTPLFLLKLISELLDGTPTKDQIECAKKIVKEMIEENEKPIVYGKGIDKMDKEYIGPILDEEAEKARQELIQ